MTALTFKPEHIAQIERGEKTQTRRLVRPGESVEPGPGPKTVVQNGRLKWQVGRRRAIKPGRTAKGVGYVRITGLRREHLQDISQEDAIAEGYPHEWPPIPFEGCPGPIAWYRALWDSINSKKTGWDANPEVWVLAFEYEGSAS